METKGEYNYYLRHSCGWFTYVPFGDVFHVQINKSHCSCGEAIPTRNSTVESSNDWEIITAKLVHRRTTPFIWWKLATWRAYETVLEKKS